MGTLRVDLTVQNEVRLLTSVDGTRLVVWKSIQFWLLCKKNISLVLFFLFVVKCFKLGKCFTTCYRTRNYIKIMSQGHVQIDVIDSRRGYLSSVTVCLLEPLNIM